MLDQLYDEAIELEEGDHVPQDELAVRRLMIRCAQLERDAEKVGRTKAAVVESYDTRLATIAGELEALRSSIGIYVERHGKIRFEDVGTAYVQRGDPRIEIVDREEFKAELAAMFVKPTFDETAAKAYALEQATETGEVVKGAQLVPGGPQLRIRKA